MRHATPAIPPSDLVRRLASGANARDMMRRGEIAGQALGLLQMVAAQSACDAPGTRGRRPNARDSDLHRLAEAN